MNPSDSSLLSPPSSGQLTPRTIAVTSGKGGVGKSNLVLNIGILLARRGCRVAILDGDLGLANLNVLLGLAPRHDLRHVVAGERRLAEIVTRGPHGLAIVPAGPGIAELADLPDGPRERLLGQLRELASSVDYLFIDTGAGIGRTVLDLIMAADEALVVTLPEPTALADAYALMKAVIAQRPSYPFHLLVNMATDVDQARQVYESLSRILVRFLGYHPGYAGHVERDSSVPRCVAEQVPFTIAAPRGPAARSLEPLVVKLAGTRPGAQEPGTFWERLTGGRDPQ